MHIFLTGYARAGKTTLLNYFQQKGWVAPSTSYYLSIKTAEFYREQFPIEISQDSNAIQILVDSLTQKQDGLWLTHTGFTCRDAKIDFAEKVIIPRLGRRAGLVKPALKYFGVSASNPKNTIMEVFNQEELIGWLTSLEELGCNEKSIVINLRRHSELAGVDKRELLGYTIWNEGQIEDTYNQIIKLTKTNS